MVNALTLQGDFANHDNKKSNKVNCISEDAKNSTIVMQDIWPNCMLAEPTGSSQFFTEGQYWHNPHSTIAPEAPLDSSSWQWPDAAHPQPFISGTDSSLIPTFAVGSIDEHSMYNADSSSAGTSSVIDYGVPTCGR